MSALEHYQQAEARQRKRLDYYKARFNQYCERSGLTPVQAIDKISNTRADLALSEIDALVDAEYHSSQLPQ